jgi:hypothetical protein
MRKFTKTTFATLEPSIESSAPNLEFEGINIQVLLQWGAAFGKHYSGAPVRHLGSQIEQYAVTIGDESWRCSAARRDVDGDGIKEIGLHVMVEYNLYSAGPRRIKQWFIPWEKFMAMKVIIEGHEIKD